MAKVPTNEDELPSPDMIDRCVAQLMEHFDTVEIIATVSSNLGHRMAYGGRGNIFARAQSVREWLLRYDTQTMMEAKEDMDDG